MVPQNSAQHVSVINYEEVGKAIEESGSLRCLIPVICILAQCTPCDYQKIAGKC